MTFNAYDDLRRFVTMAEFSSLSEAADRLHMTKGALSQQIKRLETELGFQIFSRSSRGITLTASGRDLLETADLSLRQIETKIAQLSDTPDRTLTIGVTTYFASRWLSPRLMDFMQKHPSIKLRLQPMIDLANFAGLDVDIAIRWGSGKWSDCEIEKLLSCPAWPTGNREAYEQVQTNGVEKAFAGFTLLRDRDDSNAWSEWYQAAGLEETKRIDTLIIPDPNVRVQAVLDGQGIALNDDLVDQEVKSGRMFRLSPVELTDYGYFLAYQKSGSENQEVSAFVEWIKEA